MKKLLILLLTLLLLSSSCISINKSRSSKNTGSGAATGTSIGNKAPDFTLKNTDGKDVKLSDYKGKIVILNFFGVWCPWCVKEMPGFVNVYNQYKDKNVELLVVDVGDTKSTLQGYLKDNSFSIKPLMDSGSGSTAQLYSVNGFPTTFILNKDGIIQKIDPSYTSESDLKDTLNKMTEK